MTMPEGRAIWDSGAAFDSIGEVAAARTAQAITASGETHRPAVVDKIQRFKFGVDGDPVEASFAVTPPVQTGDKKTRMEAFVVPDSTPHWISRRWLSQHQCLVSSGPNNLCLGGPCASLIWPLVNPSNTLDQYTVMIDYQNSSSGFVHSVQKRDDQTMNALQPRNHVVDKRADPDEKRAADSSMVRCRSGHPDEFVVPLDDQNEEITEQWQDGLLDWYTCRDGQCSVKSTRISSAVPQRRSSRNFCSRLRSRSVSVSTNS